MHEQIAEGDFREVMRRIPSPVMVLTFMSDGEPRGVTIGSFTSLSLNPPLISFNLMSGSTTTKEFKFVEDFAIHVLSDEQADLSNHFATPELSSGAQFNSIRYTCPLESVPVLEDVALVMICKVYELVTAGDHIIVIGELTRADISDSPNPLLYFKRAYHKVGSTL